MFAKPRSRSVPKILKPTTPYDSNGNALRNQSPMRNGTSRGETNSALTPTKRQQNEKRRTNELLPLPLISSVRNMRTSPKIQVPVVATPADVTLTEPRLTCQKFPLPKQKADGYYSKSMDLVRSLKILEKLRRTQLQNPRSLASGSKKKEAYPESMFEFDPNMFHTNNSEAFIQVTRLLFEVFDEDAFRVRFRDCWPIHDKKQESMYRRVSFAWVQDIYAEYPQFFHNQPQLAVFVTPIGDRFLRFIMSLVQCIMYVVAKRMQADEIVLEKPQVTRDTEITRTQVSTLRTRNCSSEQNVISIQKRIIQHIASHNQRQSNIESQLREEQISRAEQTQQISQNIHKYPNLFPENADQLLNSVRHELLLQVTKNNTVNLNSSESLLPDIEDPLATTLTHIWKERLNCLEKKNQRIMTFCENQKKLIVFIKALEMNLDVVLDGKDIPGLFEDLRSNDFNALPDLGVYIKTVLARINEFKNHYPIGSVRILEEPNFTNNLSHQVKRAEALVAQVKELTGNSKVEDNMINDMKFQIKTLKMKLDETDWNGMMPVEAGSKILGLRDMLTFTPPVRKYDFSQQTGLTPAMMSILPSPIFTPDENAILVNHKSPQSLGNNVRRANFRRTVSSSLQSHTTGTSGSNVTLSNKPSNNVESPVSSRAALGCSGRALHSSDKLKNLPLKLANRSFQPANEFSDDDEREDKIDDFVLKPSQVDVGYLYSSIPVSVTDSAARRQSQEHLSRLKKAVRFSESPKKTPVKENSSPFYKAESLVAAEGLQATITCQPNIEPNEDILGIMDASICDFVLMSSDEED